MSERCDDIRARLVDEGPASLAHDAEAQEHLVSCDACFAFLESIEEVDGALGSLGLIDPPAALVEATIERVAALATDGEAGDLDAGATDTRVPADTEGEGEATPPVIPAPADQPKVVRLRDRLRKPAVLAGVLAAAAAMVAVLLVPLLMVTSAGSDDGGNGNRDMVATNSTATTSSSERFGEPEIAASAPMAQEQQNLAGPQAGQPAPPPVRSPEPRLPQGSGTIGDETVVLGWDSGSFGDDDDGRFRGGGGRDGQGQMPQAGVPIGGEDTIVDGLFGSVVVTTRDQAPVIGNQEVERRIAEERAREEAGEGRRFAERERDRAMNIDARLLAQDDGEFAQLQPGFYDIETPPAENEPADRAMRQSGTEATGLPAPGDAPSFEQLDNGLVLGIEGEGYRGPNSETSTVELGGLRDLDGDYLQGLDARNRRGEVSERLRSFLADRARTEGVAIQQPRGYWANTYVPGEPGLRALYGTLSEESAGDSSGLALASQSSMVAQPFDPPEHGALAVYVHGDRSAVDGPTRMLVQVGLQGADRNHGQRPAMRVGIVLDLRRGLSPSQREQVEAILDAMRGHRDVGDAFGIFAAGERGGMVVEPGELGYGAVTVATERLFEGAGDEGLEPLEPTTLADAVEEAIIAVGAPDPTAPLGSSLVVVVTPGVDGVETNVESLAHQGAVGGVTTSVIGLGTSPGTHALDRIALAGHGNRRQAMDADSAGDAIGDELAAIGRVVARAVRLRIRLAPGVELVDVLGSRRLDEQQTQQVRDAEQSIDRRLAQSLGIEADRGEDEDGIQIVIPAFYAGDTHVILLDVIAPGPGSVADVNVRFKDLIQRANGVVSDTYAPSRGEASWGPLELPVLKSYVAYRLAESFEHAAHRLELGDLGGARSAVADLESLLAALVGDESPLSGDAGLASDLDMTRDYTRELNALMSATSQRGQELARSLRYAAFLQHHAPLSAPEDE